MSITVTPIKPRTCDQLGVCQGRTIPCLNCEAPGAEKWPPDQDTYTLRERMVWPALACALVGVELGIIYGAVRDYLPALADVTKLLHLSVLLDLIK